MSPPTSCSLVRPVFHHWKSRSRPWSRASNPTIMSCRPMTANHRDDFNIDMNLLLFDLRVLVWKLSEVHGFSIPARDSTSVVESSSRCSSWWVSSERTFVYSCWGFIIFDPTRNRLPAIREKNLNKKRRDLRAQLKSRIARLWVVLV